MIYDLYWEEREGGAKTRARLPFSTGSCTFQASCPEDCSWWVLHGRQVDGQDEKSDQPGQAGGQL